MSVEKYLTWRIGGAARHTMSRSVSRRSAGEEDDDILGLTRSFAKEVAPEGITVNSVCPGRITGAMSDGSPPELIESLKSTIPVNRYGEPEDIANLVGFLSSRGAGFITGAIHDINGGSLMI